MTTNTTYPRINSLLDQWADTELAGDADALSPLLTDDFTGVGPVGFVLTRDQWIGRHRSGEVDNREFRVSEPQVRRYGETAVVTATLTQETTARGRDTSATFRLGAVARREGGPDGDWRLAHVQLSGPIIPAGQLPDFAREASGRW